MKTLIILALFVAATSAAQTTLVSDNAPKLQDIERSAVAWKRAIIAEESELARIESDTSKRFLIKKAPFNASFTGERPVYGTKQQKIEAIKKSIGRLKAARDEEMSAMCADLK